MPKVIQPKKIFKILGVKDFDEAEKVFNTTLGFLLYLKVGQKVNSSNAEFEKISDDLILISPKVDMTSVVNSLATKKVIQFPV